MKNNVREVTTKNFSREAKMSREKNRLLVSRVIDACSRDGIFLSEEVFNREKFKLLREHKISNIFEFVADYGKEIQASCPRIICFL